MNKVKGNYEEYEIQKEVEQKHLERRKKVVDKKRQQLEQFSQRFHAQPNRASAVRNKRKMIEKLEEIDLPQDSSSIRDFDFPVAQESGYLVLSMNHLAKSYGPTTVYTDLNLEITKGQKVCLVGPNGAGKSTLLKMAAGVLEPTAGVIKLGHKVERGYFSQTRLDVLSPNRTVLDELASAVTGSVPAAQMRSLLGLFNFRGDDVFKMVKVLSGGEKSRLILAKLLISPPNFILLDEPTTHLDLDGVRALTRAFQRYRGSLCFISHDLFFVKEVADLIIEVDGGEIRSYPGGLDYYLEKKRGGATLSARAEAAEKEERRTEKQRRKKGEEAENVKLRQEREQHRAAVKRVSRIKVEIAALEKEIKDLDTESYVKARVLGNAYGKDPQLLKEYGARLKEIPKLQRQLAEQIQELEEERDVIKG